MFSRFFIDRPIFAAVLSIVITLAGFVSVFSLPIAQYPPITPPTISVQCFYPGASAQVVAESVASPIEQQVNGVENMLYMSSQCANDGSYSLSVTFEPGVNLNVAQVLVQNRVNLALPSLPDVVKQTGLTTRKRNPDILMLVSVNSPDGRYDQLYLSNYCTIQIADELKRVEGVGDVFLFGQQDYSMRIWLDPGKLASRNITAMDVVSAVRRQNVPVAAGQIGQPPIDFNQPFQMPITTLGRLREPEQFADIVVKRGTEGRIVRIRDVVSQDQFRFRVQFDPDKLRTYHLTAADVASALAPSNIRLQPDPDTPRHQGPPLLYQMSMPGTHLPTEQEVAGLEVSTTSSSKPLRLRDLVTADQGLEHTPQADKFGVHLGARSQDISSLLDGKPCCSLAVFQLPYANALDTADRVRARMEELKKNFPEGVTYDIAYDTTPFVRESVNEVFLTLRDAVILVTIVVLVFLQNWRSSLIPLVAVPVAIIGTFAAMAAIGFSLNNLTLFGLVLAIGIVVDDAIVVVEAVEHHIEEGLTPRLATIRAMDEVSGPVIAVGLVLTAVFVPCAFISGITGQFFRQFALTIAVSTVISAFNSLTLSPALAAILLKPRVEGSHRPLPRVAFSALGAWVGYKLMAGWLASALGWLGRWIGLRPHDWVAGLPGWVPWVALAVGIVVGWLVGDWLNRLLALFFRLFNFGFRQGTGMYTWVVGKALRGSVVVLVLYGGLLVLTWWGIRHLPIGYIPPQDMGNLRVSIQLPDASSVERTRRVVNEVDRISHETKGVAHTISVAGQSFVLGANGSNFGQLFITLDDFDKRHDPKLAANAIAAQVSRRCAAEIPDAVVTVFAPPPVSGLGTAGGFKFMVQDRAGLGLETLQKETENMIAKSRLEPGLAGVFTVFRANSPQLFVGVDREQCAVMGVPLRDVFSTLQIFLGSLYINDFNLFGRTWQVVVQADAPFRNRVEDVNQLKVRNSHNQMVPMGTVARVREINGPLLLTRYNMWPAAAVNGNTAPGISSGEGILLMEKLARRELPQGMSYEWTEIAYLQLKSGNTAAVIFVLAILLVFLVLAALYESWALPLAVILVVPMCLLGSITGVFAAHSDINIFTQIGFVVLVGLASKNAILIVEFAKIKREQGKSLREATLEACRLRLRPILMTSFAFILGVVPLLIAVGAGSEMRRTLGTAVFSGMIGVTLFGIFLTPVFFFAIDWLSEAEVFTSPYVRPILTVLVWAFTLGGFALVGVILLVLTHAGAIAPWVLILSGFLMAGVLLLFLGRALRRPPTALPLEPTGKAPPHGHELSSMRPIYLPGDEEPRREEITPKP